MQDLKVTLIQSSLHWESPGANMAMFEEKIWKIDQPTDLIVLPEMFTTGFTMNASKVAEPMNYNAFKWMKQQASQTGAVITGSVVIKDKGNYFNRLIWMQPDGQFSIYDKRHLFRMAGEDQVYSFGAEKIIKEIKGWKILPLICYDLRFPVWSRNIENQYDLLLYVANWPSARSTAWETLLRARAIENISYVAGLNRVGEDGNSNLYSGDSAIINAKGEDVINLQGQEFISTVKLNYNELKDFRQKFPANLDSDRFELLF
jgi:predicted amidohydrolase